MTLNYCDSCQSALCCNDVVLPIDLTLGDIYRISKHYNKKISGMFENFCSLCPNTIRKLNAITPNISFGTPCFFLKNNRCEIHSIKPTACLKFPAYAKIEKKGLYSDYACVQNPLSEEEKSLLEEDYALASPEVNLTHSILSNGKLLLLKITDWPKEIREKAEKRAKNEARSVMESKTNRALVSNWFFELSNAMKKQELVYQFYDPRLDCAEEKKLNLWVFWLEKIKSAENNKGIINQLEFSSRKYFKLRKKFG